MEPPYLKNLSLVDQIRLEKYEEFLGDDYEHVLQMYVQTLKMAEKQTPRLAKSFRDIAEKMRDYATALWRAWHAEPEEIVYLFESPDGMSDRQLAASIKYLGDNAKAVFYGLRYGSLGARQVALSIQPDTDLEKIQEWIEDYQGQYLVFPRWPATILHPQVTPPTL